MNEKSLCQYFLTIILLSGYSHGQTEKEVKACPGYCTDDFPGCRAKGGKIYSYCATNSGCCEVAGSCGQSMSAKIVFFKSPSYPEVIGGDLTCEFKAEIYEETVGLRVDFVDVEMDGQSYLQSPTEDGQCDSDMIYLKGFNWWTPPPRCGNMTGYSTIIDVEKERSLGRMRSLSVVAMMSSPSYRWHVKISQISRNQLQLRREELKEAEALLNLEAVALAPIGNIIDGGNDQGTNSVSFGSSNSNSKVATKKDPEPTAATATTDSEDSSQETTTESSDEDEDDDNRKRKINVLREGRRVKNRNRNKNSVGRAGESDTNNATIVENTLDVRESDIKPASASTQFPWKASFRINYRPVAGERQTDGSVGVCKSQEGTHFCSGSVVGDRYILSASHCFFGSSKTEGMIDIDQVQVLLGDDSNICNGSASVSANRVYKIDKITYHYGYDQNLILHDLVIVKLKTPIRAFRNNLDFNYIRLAHKEENYVGKNALVNFTPKENRNSINSATGNEETVSDEELEEDPAQSNSDATNGTQSQPKFEFTIQNQTFCNGLVSDYYSAPREKVLSHPKYRDAFESTVCVITKAASSDPEQKSSGGSGMGDSGGPLILLDSAQKPVLVGVVSYGVSPEGENNYFKVVDYFTSVSHYRQWIEISMVELQH